MAKAFWQVPLSGERSSGELESSQQLTAVVVPGRGLFEYKVMPFGLCNALTTQSRLMDLVLGYDLNRIR